MPSTDEIISKCHEAMSGATTREERRDAFVDYICALEETGWEYNRNLADICFNLLNNVVDCIPNKKSKLITDYIESLKLLSRVNQDNA
jgi:hypothetical protein